MGAVHGYPGLPPDLPLPSVEESLAGNNGGAGPVRLIQEPGSGFRYSGGGYTILQLLVEEVTRESFAGFMQREVLGRLGLAQSDFDWRGDLRAATAGAYGSNQQRLPNFLFAEQAAAGLYATALDLGAFVAAFVGGPDGEPAGRGVLSAETVALARSPAPGTGGAYGLGVEIWPLSDQEAAIGHGGANVGWRARWAALPARRAGLVILTNSENGDGLATEVTCEWMRRAAGAVAAFSG
jgi:CubicO group peptidase (beta-lactamase class C family)